MLLLLLLYKYRERFSVGEKVSVIELGDVVYHEEQKKQNYTKRDQINSLNDSPCVLCSLATAVTGEVMVSTAAVVVAVVFVY